MTIGRSLARRTAVIALGAVTVLAPGSPPAFAVPIYELHGTGACDPKTGHRIVTWSVRNLMTGPASLSDVHVTPPDVAFAMGTTVPGETTITGIQRIVTTVGQATFTGKISWPEVSTTLDLDETVTLPTTCPSPTPSVASPTSCAKANELRYRGEVKADGSGWVEATTTTRLCAGQSQQFVLVSYAVDETRPGQARKVDSVVGVLDHTDRRGTLKVPVPPGCAILMLALGTETIDRPTAGPTPYGGRQLAAVEVGCATTGGSGIEAVGATDRKVRLTDGPAAVSVNDRSSRRDGLALAVTVTGLALLVSGLVLASALRRRHRTG